MIFPDHTHLLFLNLYVTNSIVSSKIYDKRNDFNFELVNFPFSDGDVHCSSSYGVYISQRIRLQECVLMLMTSTTETYFYLIVATVLCGVCLFIPPKKAMCGVSKYTYSSRNTFIIR